MKQNSQSHFPVRTAHSLRMKIVAIIAAIAVIVFLAGCACPPGTPPPGDVSILLLAETSQLAKVHNGTVVTDLPRPPSLAPDNPDIFINTTFTRQIFKESVDFPPPTCRVALNNTEILDQFDRIQNKGDTPIYAVIVPDAPAGNIRFNNRFTYKQVFAELQEDFPDYERLRTAFAHLSGGYQELFIHDGTGPPDPATAPRWENAKNFVDRFTEEICDGNAAICKYMTVIEPGTTGHIVSTSFARSRSLDGR